MATRLLGQWAQIESSLAPTGTVLLFTLGVLALAGLLFGLALCAWPWPAEPNWRSRLRRQHRIRCGKSRMGRTIVALQMTLCVVLLVGAGLLIRTLRNLENTPLGMRVDGLVVFGLKPIYRPFQGAGPSTATCWTSCVRSLELNRDHRGGTPWKLVVR